MSNQSNQKSANSDSINSSPTSASVSQKEISFHSTYVTEIPNIQSTAQTGHEIDLVVNEIETNKNTKSSKKNLRGNCNICNIEDNGELQSVIVIDPTNTNKATCKTELVILPSHQSPASKKNNANQSNKLNKSGNNKHYSDESESSCSQQESSYEKYKCKKKKKKSRPKKGQSCPAYSSNLLDVYYVDKDVKQDSDSWDSSDEDESHYETDSSYEDIINANERSQPIKTEIPGTLCEGSSSKERKIHHKFKIEPITVAYNEVNYQTRPYEHRLTSLENLEDDDDEYNLREENFLNNNDINDPVELVAPGEQEELEAIEDHYTRVFNGLDSFIEEWGEHMRNYSCFDVIFEFMIEGILWTWKQLVELTKAFLTKEIQPIVSESEETLDQDLENYYEDKSQSLVDVADAVEADAK